MDPESELKRLAQRRRELANARKQLDEVEIEVTAPDNSVGVVVTSSGRIKSFKISESAYQTHTREALERTLLAVTKAAQDAAAQTTERVVKGFVPEAALKKIAELGKASR